MSTWINFLINRSKVIKKQKIKKGENSLNEET